MFISVSWKAASHTVLNTLCNIIITSFTQSFTPFLMIYQASLLDNDPLCPFAGIISGMYIYFVITFKSYTIFDLYTV